MGKDKTRLLFPDWNGAKTLPPRATQALYDTPGGLKATENRQPTGQNVAETGHNFNITLTLLFI